MSEVGRISVAIEATGLDKASSDMEKLERAGQKAAVSVRASMGAVEKEMLAVERIIAKATAGISTAIGGLDKTIASGFSQTNASLAKIQAEMKATQAAIVDAMKGVAPAVKPATESLEDLRAKFNPLYSIGQTYKKQVEEIRAAHAAGALSAAEMSDAIDRASSVAMASQKTYVRLREHVEELGNQTKLTGDQLRNLGYQANDAVTMFLSGASPFQILATQAGQVVQALQDGPGGVKGSLEAIKDSAVGAARAIGPVGLALGGATIAAGALYFAIRDKVQPIEDVIKRQADSVRDLRDAYNLVAPAAEEAGRRSAAALKFETTEQVEKDLKRLRAEVQVFYEEFESVLQDQPGSPEMYAPLRKVFADLKASAESGIPAFKEARDALTAIAETDPTKGFLGFGNPVRDFAKAMLDAAEDGEKLQAGLQGVQDELSEVATRAREAAAALQQARSDMAGFLPEAKTQAEQIEAIYQRQSAAIRNLGGDDRDMQSRMRQATEDRRKALAELSRDSVEQAKAAREALDNLSLSPDQRGLAEIRQRYDAEIAELERTNGAEEALAAKRQERADALRAAEIEIGRAEEARRAGYDLDLRAVEARTAAEKAAVEAERVRIDLIAEGYSASEAAARAEEARTLSLAQARQQLNETYRQQGEAIAQQIAQAQLELELVGQSVGETARLRAEFEMLTAARQAAVAAGFDASEVTLTDAMRTQAAEIGRLTEATQRLNFERDILFERQQATRSPEEQAIADQLRSMGIEYESAQGRADAAQIRLNNRLHESNDLLWDMRDAAKDAFGDMVGAIASGESAMDALMGTFARFGAQLASAGLERLTNGLFGTGQGAAASGGIGAAASTASTVLQQIDYTAPIGKVTRGALPPLVTGEGFSSGRASQVAGQSVPAQMWNFFAGKGLSNHQIAGILGNAKAESAFNPAAIGDAGHAFGLFQWNDRGPAMKNFVGGDWRTDVRGQLEFAWKELQTSESRAYRALLQATDVVSATEAFLGFERPSGYNTGVRNSHNYSGRVANARAAYGQFAGSDAAYSAPERVSSTVDFARAVETGNINATRKIASGGVPGVSVGGSSWGAQFDGVQNMSPMVNGAAGGGGMLGGLQSFMQSPFGMGAMNAVSGFASGFQSGDPVSGGLTGALGALGMGLGPVGIIAGGLAGLAGGLFGGRSKKKEEARQRKMAADQAWSDNYNSLLEYKDVVYRTPKGALSGQLTELERTLDQFAKLADATKDGGNRQHIEDIRDQLGRYSELLKSMFRDTLPTVLEDLSAGRGLDTAFTKARDSVQAEAEAYRGLIEDVKLSFQPDMSGRDRIMDDYEDQVNAANKALRSAQSIVSRSRTAKDWSIDEKEAARDKLAKAQKESSVGLLAAEKERDAALAEWDRLNADIQARYQETLAKAVQAARDGLLRIVSGDVIEQSDIEAALAEARGAAAGLDVALKDLGMSADEAATAIQGALDKRIALLAETFTRGLQDQIDELDGKGYLASFRDLIEQRDTLLKDASLINVDTSLVSTFFAKQAQNLVDGAELAGDGFAELIKLFPELSGVVTESADAVDKLKDKLRAITERIEGYDERRFSATEDTSTLAGAMAAFNRRAARERYAEGLAGGEGMFALDAALAAEKVATIQGLLIQARQDEVSEIEDTINRLEGLRDEWKDLRDSLKLDDTLSPLSQYDQFLEAQKQFREISAKAAAGDEDAQAKLAGISQSYLEEAKAYYASSEDYYATFREVQGVLENAETLADQQLKLQQSTLDVAKAQLDAMNGVKDSVSALAAALMAAQTAAAAAAAAAGVVPSGGSTGTPSVGGGTATGGSSFIPKNDLEHFLGVQYGAILGRAPDAAGVGYYQALRDQGATADQLIAMIKNSPEAKARGYAFGGLVSGPGTGTSDSIMARLSAGEFVMPARAVTPQTLPMLEGMRSGRMAGNDNAEMIAELRGLRAEVRSLRATVAEGELANVAATRAGVAAQQAAAVEQKKAGSRGR